MIIAINLFIILRFIFKDYFNKMETKVFNCTSGSIESQMSGSVASKRNNDSFKLFNVEFDDFIIENISDYQDNIENEMICYTFKLNSNKIDDDKESEILNFDKMSIIENEYHSQQNKNQQDICESTLKYFNEIKVEEQLVIEKQKNEKKLKNLLKTNSKKRISLNLMKKYFSIGTAKTSNPKHRSNYKSVDYTHQKTDQLEKPTTGRQKRFFSTIISIKRSKTLKPQVISPVGFESTSSSSENNKTINTFNINTLNINGAKADAATSVNNSRKHLLVKQKEISLVESSISSVGNSSNNDIDKSVTAAINQQNSNASSNSNLKTSLNFFTQTMTKKLARLKYNLFIQRDQSSIDQQSSQPLKIKVNSIKQEVKHENESAEKESPSVCRVNKDTTNSDVKLASNTLSVDNHADNRVSKSLDNINHLIIDPLKYASPMHRKLKQSTKLSKSLDINSINAVKMNKINQSDINDTLTVPSSSVTCNESENNRLLLPSVSEKNNLKSCNNIPIDAIEKFVSTNSLNNDSTGLTSPTSLNSTSTSPKKHKKYFSFSNNELKKKKYFYDYKLLSDCRTFEEKKFEINDFDLIYYLSTKCSKQRRHAICAKIDKTDYNRQLQDFMEYLLREDYIRNFLL